MPENKSLSSVPVGDATPPKGEDAPSKDVLTLNEVLNEALIEGQADACNVTSNLQFRFDSATGNTVVDVKSPDGSETKAQQIVLQGVDLTSGGSLNDSQVIQLLLAQGKPFD